MVREFAALGGASAAGLDAIPARSRVTQTKCRDAQVARGGAREAQGAGHAGAAFQPTDAKLTQIGAVAAVDHTDEHAAIAVMGLAESRALPGAVCARGDTRLDLLRIHGCLSGKRGPQGRWAKRRRRVHGVFSLQL